MENLKSGFKTIIITLAITFSLTGCTQIINVLDFIGVIPPWEQMHEFQFEKHAFEKPFTFADYCKEEYDSIFLVYPYFNIEKEDFVNLKMSDKLRGMCESNACSDSFSTLLFINDGIVKVYSIIATSDAHFAAREIEKHYIFPFQQKFIMDKERKIHIYNE